MTQGQGIESATGGCFRILSLAFLEVLSILFLAGCAPIDNHITFYGGEEWVVEIRITLDPEQKSKEGSSIEAEIERRAIEWRKRDVRYDWHIEKKEDNTAYVVNAQGRGWQTLNDLVFDKQAIIQPTKNIGEISFSYSGKDVPVPTSLRLTGRKIMSSNADEVKDDTAIWKNVKSRERVEAVLIEKSRFPLPVSCLGGILFLFAPIGLFVQRKMSSTTSLFDSISVSVQGMV